MALKQGIDINIDSKGKECILTMSAFPISIANNKPNRKQVVFNKKFNFYFDHPLLQNKILDTISNNMNSQFNNTLYVTKDSEAHLLLKNSIFQNNVKISGAFFREQKSDSIKQDFKYYEPKNNNKNTVFLDLDIFTHKLYKSREISLSAYDNFEDLKYSQNPIFSSREIKNKNVNNLHSEFIKSLFIHIENFQEQGKQVQIHSTSHNLPFISSLNNYLKDNNFEPVSIKIKKDNYQYRIEAENRISKELNEIYDNLLNVKDKYLICSDGGILFGGTSQEQVSGAFIVVSENKKNSKQISSHEKNQNVQYAELFALKEALLYMVDNNKTDKPINFVLDSDYASQELQSIIKDDPNLSIQTDRHRPILNEISNIISKHNLEVDSIVLKSHQAIGLKHEIVELNDEVDNLVRKVSKTRKLKNSP